MLGKLGLSFSTAFTIVIVRNRLFLRLRWLESSPPASQSRNSRKVARQERTWEQIYHGKIPVRLQKTLSQHPPRWTRPIAATSPIRDDSRRFFETLYHEACSRLCGDICLCEGNKMPCWPRKGWPRFLKPPFWMGRICIGHLDPLQVERCATSRQGELPGLVGLLRASPGNSLPATPRKRRRPTYYLSACVDAL